MLFAVTINMKMPLAQYTLWHYRWQKFKSAISLQ